MRVGRNRAWKYINRARIYLKSVESGNTIDTNVTWETIRPGKTIKFNSSITIREQNIRHLQDIYQFLSPTIKPHHREKILQETEKLILLLS